MRYYVNVYNTNRAYGGPEEGGYGNRHPNSVLCNGWFDAWVEGHPPEVYPQERPYYE